MISASLQAADIKRFSRGFEAMSWLLTLILGSLIFLLPQAALPGRQARLIVAVALLVVANLLFHRFMPEASDGPISFVKEDKALVVSLAMVLLLTAFLYVVPEAAEALSYLYLIPLVASTLVLHDNVVLSEALFSLLAMLFLRATAWVGGTFWEGEFVLRLMVFATASGCLVVVTRSLRRAFSRVNQLTSELSIRLDQIQIIDMLVRQSEHTAKIDRLASRTGEIIADAADFERYVIFVLDGDGLRRVGEDAGFGVYDRELMSVEENLLILRGVIETGTSHVFGAEAGGVERFIGNSRIRDILVVPMRVHESSIGALCLINRRKDRFTDADARYCELLVGFVATLMNAALLLQKTLEERRTVERMAKLMVGREIKMRDLKGQIKAADGT